MCRTEKPWSVRSEAVVWTSPRRQWTVGLILCRRHRTQREEVVRNPEYPDEYNTDDVLMTSASSSYRSLRQETKVNGGMVWS